METKAMNHAAENVSSSLIHVNLLHVVVNASKLCIWKVEYHFTMTLKDFLSLFLMFCYLKIRIQNQRNCTNWETQKSMVLILQNVYVPYWHWRKTGFFQSPPVWLKLFIFVYWGQKESWGDRVERWGSKWGARWKWDHLAERVKSHTPI